MGKTLYLECYSGISGDMTVAALLDLGADQEVLEGVLKSLPVQGFETKITRVKKSGIAACDFDVILDAEIDGHDHDMEYLHGHDGEAGHVHHHHEGTKTHDAESRCAHLEDAETHSHGETDLHSHDSEHTHNHGEAHLHSHDAEHTHSHGEADLHSHDEEHSHPHEHVHHHEHRGMKEIRQIIDGAAMTDGARETARKIFEILAAAEAKAHNVPVEEVHFHEVGAVDSIVDILSVAVCLDNLGIEDVIVPTLYEGIGTIRCQHGILPVPVPAVANIAAQCGLDLHITNVQGELVTPTGAAIVAAVRTSKTLPENFTVEKIGIGAGKRTYACPGILRAMLIVPEEKTVSTTDSEKNGSVDQQGTDSSDDKDVIYKLETNIDDCSGEVLGFVMERLFEAGARDVHYTPVYMKKNRPAWLLTVICKEEDVPGMEALIFAETTSIGIRRARMERTILPRKKAKVMIPFGEVEVKICGPEGAQKCYPEYESLIKICKKTGISYAEAYQMTVEASRNLGE